MNSSVHISSKCWQSFTSILIKAVGRIQSKSPPDGAVEVLLARARDTVRLSKQHHAVGYIDSLNAAEERLHNQ